MRASGCGNSELALLCFMWIHSVLNEKGDTKLSQKEGRAWVPLLLWKYSGLAEVRLCNSLLPRAPQSSVLKLQLLS